MRILLIAIVLLCTSLCSFAQKRKLHYSGFFKDFYYKGPLSVTIGGGLSAYRGDLCGKPQCNTLRTVYSFGLNYRTWPHILLGAEVNYFHLQARSHGKYNVIEFTSSNIDLRAYFRYYLLDDKIVTFSRHITRRVKPYVQVGVAGVYYNPSSHFLTKPTNSKVLTEGRKYPGLTPGFPIGGGFCFTFSSRISLLAEAMYVITLSDYLDDAGANRGNGNGLPDSYGTVSLKLQVSLFVKD